MTIAKKKQVSPLGRFRGVKKLLSILLLLTFVITVNAQQPCLLEQKPVQELVQDYANILSESEEKSLTQALLAFNDTTSTQILIVTVTDLCGYDKAQFTYTLGEKWKVGQDGKDNGVVIMVKPNGAKGDRHTFIAPGRGIEGVLPDAICKRIVTNEMIPNFENKDYYEGIAKASQTVMEITAGEYSADEYAKGAGLKSLLPFLLVIIIIIIFMVMKGKQTSNYASTNGMSFWAAWALLNASSRGSSGGSYGNFSSGSGGFGGFGGGSFGGGGAGGSW